MYDGYVVGGELGSDSETHKEFYHLGSVLQLLTDHANNVASPDRVIGYMESEQTLAGYELFFGNEMVRDELRKVASGSRNVEINGCVSLLLDMHVAQYTSATV